MTEPIAVRRAPRRARLVLVVGLVVAVAAGVGSGLGVRGGDDAPARAIGPIPLGKHDVCAGVEIDLDTDARMRKVAATVADDPQARVVYTQTKQQTYQWYLWEFADEPELQALGRPEALPASVVVLAVSGTDLRRMAARFRKQFPGVEEVKALIQAPPLAFIAVSASPPPPCPDTGEFGAR